MGMHGMASYNLQSTLHIVTLCREVYMGNMIPTDVQ